MYADDDNPQDQAVPEPAPAEPPINPPDPPAPEIVEPPEPEQTPAKQTDWRDREIARLRSQRDRERRELETLRAASSAPPVAVGPDANAEFQRLVREEASKQASMIAAAEIFSRQCNEAAEAGKKTYSDFDQKVNSLKGLVDFNDNQQATAYNTFLSAALETGEAPRLIYELGTNPDEASRIMSLGPVKMAVELAKMAAKEPTEVSNAPRPIVPVTRANSNRNPISPDDPDRADQLSKMEWQRRRAEQVLERQRTRFGR